MQERRTGISLGCNGRAVELVRITCQSLGLNSFTVDGQDRRDLMVGWTSHVLLQTAYTEDHSVLVHNYFVSLLY